MATVRLYTALLLSSACHSRSEEVHSQACAPTTGELPATSTAEGLAGVYRLRLVAISGTRKGVAVEGTLKLRRQDDALRYRIRPGGSLDSTVTHPLYGAVDIDLAPVDAVLLGSTTSLDPMRPGVLVMERHGGPASRSQITIRLGSDANRRDRTRFDGGYTALYVRQVSPTRVAGAWASGVSRERSAGYFCASRTE